MGTTGCAGESGTSADRTAIKERILLWILIIVATLAGLHKIIFFVERSGSQVRFTDLEKNRLRFFLAGTVIYVSQKSGADTSPVLDRKSVV
jgi:hypothetical protein